jgi:hypothetical protein
MVAPDERTEWQRRYDRSLAEEREKASDDEVTIGEIAAFEASGCLPGGLGAVVFAATTAVVLMRRRARRRSPRQR